MKYTLVTLIVATLAQSTFSQPFSKPDTITNTNVEPFSQVCYQEIFRVRKGPLKNRSFQSTGFLIAPNIILTAAHNLYSDQLTKVTNIKIFPGRYKDQCSYDSIEISGESLSQRSIRVHPSFNWNRVEYDFGIIVIPDSIIKKTNHWPKKPSFTLDSTFTFQEGDTIHVAGFPASDGYDGSLMIYESQRCENLKNKSFSHDFDTQTGNSGSPIWIEIKGERKVVGIHTYAEAGTKIDKEYIKLISSWIRQMTITHRQNKALTIQ